LRSDDSHIFVSDPDFTLYLGDALQVLRGLPADSIHCCVTSPPYWGLRDYGADGQLGLEPTPEEYVAAMVAVFAEVRRVLRSDGTLWLNLGDSYNAYNGNAKQGGPVSLTQSAERPKLPAGHGLTAKNLKPKDLVGIPWRVALALQGDGWTLRSDIIWAKANPMPESVTDRPTKAHEYLFLLSKGPRYFYDADAIREAYADWREGDPYPTGNRPEQGKYREVRNDSGITQKPRRSGNAARKPNPAAALGRGDTSHGIPWEDDGRGRNARTVWEIASQPYPEAHFAVFPEELPRRCIAAGCPAGGIVLDPFMGSGTTALVARRLGRKAVGIELNPEYAELAARRLGQQSLLAPEAAA
jgi:DNA modification methylase